MIKSGRVCEVERTSAWIRSTAQIRLLINRKLIGVGRTSNV